MDTKKTISTSTDKLKALQEPPTKIVEEKLQLDPIKVIKAWADSADVLRDVAQGVQENLLDNERTREAVEGCVRTMRRLTLVAVAIAFLTSAVSVYCMLRIREDSSKMSGAMSAVLKASLAEQKSATEHVQALKAAEVAVEAARKDTK